MNSLPIMGHLVLGYPNLEQSYQNARKYAQSGFNILELQIPFSHPTADGALITQANRVATAENNVTIDECFEIIERIKDEFPCQEIILMTYINKVYTYGVDLFIKKASSLNISDIIIPDLPFDHPIADKINNSKTLSIVPVIAANIEDKRLIKAIETNPNHFYIMSEFKITGQGFGLHENISNRVNFIKSKSNAKIGIGFGISTKAHIEAITQIADYAIIGSALIAAQKEGQLQQKIDSYL